MGKSKKIVLFDIDYTIFNTEKLKQTGLEVFSLYEEVYDVLQSLAPIVDLGIFSEGDIALQQKKLKQTNIEQYFLKEHINIVPQKVHAIEMLIKKYKNGNKVFLVDDRLPILPLVKKDCPSVFTIWIKRGPYAMSQGPIKGFSPDAEVDTLKEIIPLIASH